MIRLNLIVVFKANKTNAVVLSCANHRKLLINDTSNSCLKLTSNKVDHYCSSHEDHTIGDTEIGINAAVADAMGLHAGCLVSCKVVDGLSVLKLVHVAASSKRDWEILESSSFHIQNILLQQARIVAEGQKLIVWINNAIRVSLRIDKLLPNIQYGKINDSTEIIVESNRSELKRKNVPTESQPKESKHGQESSLYQRLFNRDGKQSDTSRKPNNGCIIDSRTLDNVSNESDSNSTEDSSGGSKESSYDDSLDNIVNNNHTKNSVIKSVRFDVQARLFDALLVELNSQIRKTFIFRAIPLKWDKFQMCDVFLTKQNTPFDFDAGAVHVLSSEYINSNDERLTKEYYVNIKPGFTMESNREKIDPFIEINDVLMAHLKIPKFSRVTLSTKKTALNFVDRIELILDNSSKQTDRHAIREDFKRLVLQHSSTSLLINQDQIFKLCGGKAMVSAKIYPVSFRYCLCDCEILRENKLFVSEQESVVSPTLTTNNEATTEKELDKNKPYIELNTYKSLIEDCVKNIVTKNCLDGENNFHKTNNYLIIGSHTSGRSRICRKIVDTLERHPYNCYTTTFNCSQNKARKVESIQKDLRNILSVCIERAPSVLILENLDAIAKSISEHSSNSDYYNHIADLFKHLITNCTHNTISILATVTSINNLNQHVYTARGNNCFCKIYKIPDLSKENRKKIIHKLCEYSQIKCDSISYDRFANLTEGYTIGYISQFVDRAIFYAHRDDKNNPVLTNEVLLEALKATSATYLQNVKHNINTSINKVTTENIRKFHGLEAAVGVLEEVLLWPAKYPHIFRNSPLRNQAGILLYGAPGTGKTYLMSQISRQWDLRVISIKGPELLAKFIGQSEENVRSLFNRARDAKPCVLFFDEFDSIAPRRGHDSTGVTDRVVNQILTELDGVEELKGVVVVAATSRPDLLDPALLRSGRIDRLVHCAMPDLDARLNIFKLIAQESSLKLSEDVNFNEFCDKKTENYTGADIKSVLVSANMVAVKEIIAQKVKNLPEKVYISQKHIAEAFKNTTPSLSSLDAEKYKSLYSRFVNQEVTNPALSKQRTTLA